ncbi:cysteine synthase family protein [Rhizobium sp. XQZ8]|uniref:cysteine synthase family protein n=1 Tax=Rhizobium populisoli TaxID=2859785 RepID=UPI001C666B7D|nr:cysteine synthase family protein [Rhizobium populisoli]MBW6425754.1 cysteine synthase family protein [Rhizobium populisoli]
MTNLQTRYLAEFEMPRVVPLGPNLYAAAFFLMKLLPARYILERALERGDICEGTHICETSSGTFALALAMITARMENRLTIVSDWALEPTLKRRLVELGAEVEIVTQAHPHGGLQKARLDRLNEILAQSPSHFWPRQYDNPDNPRAYGSVAAKLVDRIGQIDCLVGTVGSGGSLCGTASYLRLLFPDMVVIGVDTINSVLFGQPDAPRLVRGLGGSVIPSNVDHTLIDEVHWLSAAEIFQATRQLHSQTGLFMGPTSAAAHKVASWWAAHNDDKTVVILMPDEGHRYADSAYDDDWLNSKVPRWRSVCSDRPVTITNPHADLAQWTRLEWGRRPRSDVIAQSL